MTSPMNTLEYKSFLLRLWREKSDPSVEADWEAEIEHIQSGERWEFGTLDEMLEFLQREMGEAKGCGET
jgi:hypothetical protein